MRVIASVLLLLVASTASAQDATDYPDLRASRPDGRRIPVKDLVLDRDAFRITLQSGAVHLLAPLGRDTFGAVFIGQGNYLLNPATASERRHLQLASNSQEVLRDRFTKLILLFTDRTAAEVLAHAPVETGTADQAATRAYEDYLNRQRNDLPNFHLRVLADLLNRPTRTDGVFMAFVEGQDYSPVLLAVDPLGISNLTRSFSFFGGEEVALFSFNNMNGGLWYSSTYAKDAVDGRGKPARMLADSSHYDIDTTLDGGSLRGTTTITFAPTMDGVRVLPLELFPKLRIRTATVDRGGTAVPLTVLQEGGSNINGDAADVALQFRDPLSRDVPVKVTLTYEGSDVVTPVGGGVFSIGARESWYPNVGIFDDVATYSMTFRFPARNDLISVGEQVSERTEGGRKVAVWRSQVPIRVAGFNYGDYDKKTMTDAQAAVTVDVYATKGPENFLAMAGTPLADAVNTARVGTLFFGTPSFQHISLTQQPQMASAQSWPSLVYLSTVSFVGGSDFALGFQGVDPRQLQGLKEFGNVVTWHEVAHQWWGHQVGWSSYRDQWLSEGFAEFTAALLLEVNSGKKKADAFWESRRGEVLNRTTGVANSEAGAITQGFRLRTQRSPQAAQATIYSKGAYVVHMLRMMMQEATPDPDRAFKAMMADFVKTWTGKNPSTSDFQAVAERHMTRDMNLGGDGTLDYFFKQWVYGTDIPTLTSSLEAADSGGGKYQITGTITQAGVPADFRTRVPIYLDFGNDKTARLGTLVLTGATSTKVNVQVALPQKPRRVFINGYHDVLTR